MSGFGNDARAPTSESSFRHPCATPGWHSTEYPPFFVFGALWSGLATVTLLVLVFRRVLGDTGLKRHDVSEVILVGRATRMPAAI